MAKKVRAFLLTVCLLFAVEASAITSGNEWKQFPLEARQGYILGVVDTWAYFGEAASLAGQQPPVVIIFTELVKCAGGMTYGQINAIVQKYMENNPAEWHFSMASLVWSALHEVCKPTSK
jgi:Rap1a immunity proteins